MMRSGIENKANLHMAVDEADAEARRKSRRGSKRHGRPLVGAERTVWLGVKIATVAALCVGCYLVVSRYFFQSVQIVGVSMSPTLEEHGSYFLNRWTFHTREPKRSEIVVIKDPSDQGFSVKRIIAVSGDSIYFKNGKVFVNGQQLDETYLPKGTMTFTYSQIKEEMINCGKDQYFVLGDNRLKSIDSRNYGAVPRQNILGLVEVH